MPPTRWLTEDEQQTWRIFLSGVGRFLAAVDAGLQRDADMPHGYYELLVRLSEAPGRAMRMSELAERSLSSRSRLSHAVARLEERGWVRREECASDRRGQVAVLTDDGFAALAAAAPAHVDTVRSLLFEALTTEQVAQLREIFDAVLERVQAAGAPCADAAPADVCSAACEDD